MFKSKLSKVIVSLLRRIAGVTRSGAKRLMRAMLQTLMAMGRRARLPVAGFVLPTVTMVLLVVILLTVAITLRSFDRANTARNVRVNQQVLAAATPALDRAKAKIQYALSPQGSGTLETPSELSVYQALDSARFKFGDEDVLQVKVDIDNSNVIEPAPVDLTKINESERINTAWRFPVDTDNNGKFDTYTLYGIYFRSPPRDANTGEFNRARKGLEARTPPMSVSQASTNAICKAAAGTSASLVGSSDWYKAEGVLKKSFFVYTVNVPINDITGVATPADYEIFKGSPSFSALEYQQDQKRIPLQNNAVVYEDDLEVSPGPALRLNGRIFTNSNFVVTHTNTGPVTFYLVSSRESCFYNLENSKIVISGNVVNGFSGGADNISKDIGVHLFGTTATDPELGKSIKGPDDQSVAYKDGALGVIYNNKAYSDRIGLLVSEQEKNAANSDPLEVKNAIAKQVEEETDPTPPSPARQEEIRREKLESYFRLRTRKVPFAEVPAAGDALAGYVDPVTKVVTTSPFGGTGEELRPVDPWVIPSDTNTKLDTTKRLKANSPEKVEENNKESELGDRIIVGNNLPALRWRSDLNPPKFVGEGEEGRDLLGVDWLDGGERYREPQVKQFADVGGAQRDGFWELSAAQAPETAVDAIGGLRVITGAGVYERTNSFLPPPKVFNPAANAVSEFYDDPATTAVEKFPVVWPDSMPMSPGPNSKVYNNNSPAGTDPWVLLSSGDWETLSQPAAGATPLLTPTAPTIDPNTRKYAKGDLRMRATAIYHYADNEGAQAAKLADTPLACVSSYYDPSYRYSKGGTLFDSSLNGPDLPEENANGKSNNGIVYGRPEARPTGATLTAALMTDPSGLTSVGTTENRLNYQASLVFPDGRFVNENLRKALQKADGARSLSEKAAIDSTLCSFKILAAPTTGFSTTYLEHGTIREVAFLNPREVKAIDKDDPATAVDETYSLSSPLSSSTGSGLMAPAQRAQLTGQYDLPLAERQPLEIRVTQLDIDKLRIKTLDYKRTPTINTLKPEYMLPYSGLIYASRDDGAPDRSDRTPNSLGNAIDETRSKLSSSTDSRLDPSRRPHGIMLINGSSLGRPTTVATVTDVLKEKGLLLTSNLPVYIQGAFNTHTQREFGTGVATAFDWTPSAFYGRLGTTLNPNFACRLGDPRYPGKCAGSDNWRGATVLSDAITLLSEPESGNLQEGFRYGVRNHGDFDLRNNAGSTIVGYDFNGDGSLGTNTVSEVSFDFDLNGNGNKTDTTVKETDVTAKAARRINGFGANNYVTNGLSSGAAFDIINQEKFGQSTGTSVSPQDENYRTNTGAAPNSSYFNNFITPVQRRANNSIKFPEYVMEICRKLPVSACGPNDWVVGIDAGTTGVFDAPAGPDEIKKASTVPVSTAVTKLLSGTTAKPAIDPADRRYPRRVAFVRDNSGKLVLDSNSRPIALGIASPTAVAFYATSTTPVTVDGTPITPVTGQPQLADNALWYATTNTPANPNAPTQINYGKDKPLFYAKLPTATVEQPQLRPTLQIQATNSNPVAGLVPIQGPNANDGTRWMQRARTTEFNLIVASNDVPSRALSASLGETNGGMQNLPRFMENWRGLTTSIAGSFIQFKRSAYATAPYQSVLDIATTTPFNAKIFDSRLEIPADTRSIYRVQNALGAIGYFVAPDREWGFDVGLLSQPPDLFAQKFTLPATQKKPDEYFREISRDDDWVRALLCAEKLNNDPARTFSGKYAANDSATKPRTDCPKLS
ncbi:MULTISPECIES: hormogonium polysaccharide biosynthesis protein HpsA [unclassified Microcoleus]|uniref:hormogonium polysaccharide biosynthesis protein HpsA n=1 Tax=unclassified Microcoleus TaxID=2642155 RepID=UPI002FD2EC48